MQILNLFIPGIPKPKQSARFRTVKAGKKTFVQSYQTKAVKEEERSIKMIIKEQLPEDFICHDGPIEVASLKFSFPPVSSLRSAEKKMIQNGLDIPKITKPDLTDNLAKGLFDAMEGIVYTNDSKIFHVRKSLKVMSNTPGIKIKLLLFDSMKGAIQYQHFMKSGSACRPKLLQTEIDQQGK